MWSVKFFLGFCFIFCLIVGFVRADLANVDEKAANRDEAGKEESAPNILNEADRGKIYGMSNTILKNIEERLIGLNFNISFGFEVLDDKRVILKDFSSILDRVSFYSVLIHSKLPYIRLTVALDEDHNVFVMPQEINMIISENFKRNMNEDKALELAKLYVVLSAVPPHYYQLVNSALEIANSKNQGISPLKYKEIIHRPTIEEHIDYYTVKLFVWNNIGGSLELWKLLITNRAKLSKEKETIGKGIGDFEVIQ